MPPAAVHDLVLILLQLSLNDLLHKINGNVHIVADLFGTNDISLYRNRYLDLLTILLHAQCHMCLCIGIEVLFQLTDLLLYSSLQSGCNLNVPSNNYKFHTNHPFRLFIV